MTLFLANQNFAEPYLRLHCQRNMVTRPSWNFFAEYSLALGS